MNKIINITFVAVAALLTSCATGEKFSSVRNGMSMREVESIVGTPDEALTYEGNQVYKWIDRIVSGWGMDKADYYVVFDHNKNDTVAKYGRENFRARVIPAYRPTVYEPTPTPKRLDCTSSTMGGTVYTDCN